MRFAIVGFSQSGKSSLFRILCGPQAGQESYGVRVGAAQVPDERLDGLTEIYQPKKVVRASIEFLDSPPLVNDPEKDTQVLSQVRGADAFAHIVRVFGESPDPAGDLAALETEFLLIDHDTVTKRIQKVEKDLKKSSSKELEFEKGVLVKARDALAAERSLRAVEWQPEEEKLLRGFMLLSAKPLLAVLNAPEEMAAELGSLVEKQGLAAWSERANVEVTAICGTIEAELSELDDADAAEFLTSYGLGQSARGRMVQAARNLLGLITILTASESECRSWFVPANATAFEFAGIIHSDIARRFVKAEVVRSEDLIDCGGFSAAREKGLVRLESKQYPVQDGEVVHIRHTA